MEMQPFNRYVWVRKEEKSEKDESEVLLPDGYQTTRGPEFVVVEVIAIADDAPDLDFCCGDSIIVRNSMIESVSVPSGNFNIILTNHIVGKIVE
jgi:co-chaperonin GroES (HSP10)